MPNQRAKNKLYLGGFVDKRLHAQILREARRSGMQDNKFGLAAELIQEALKDRGRVNGKAVRARA